MTSSRLDEYLLAIRGVERVTTRCSYCDFFVSLPFEQAREAG